LLTISENSDSPCDTGSDLKTIAAEYPELDFANVDPTFPDKAADTPYAFTRTANAARGQICLQKLYSRSEKVIAVVSHSGFLRTAISKRYHALEKKLPYV
jgi:broad specificity phosphatase PhoE